MRTSKETIKDIELLLEEYEKILIQRNCEGILMPNTVKTYLLHSTNFVKWCKGEFNPGERNM